MEVVNTRKISYQAYLEREGLRPRRIRYDEQSRPFELMRSGDLEGVKITDRVWRSGVLDGRILTDDVRNYQYLMGGAATLCARYAIEGGMEQERAYEISDLYLKRADQCHTKAELLDLHQDMFTFYTMEMRHMIESQVSSRPILVCTEYIYDHLHEKITLTKLAKVAGLNASYLSVVFKKETGKTVSAYIEEKRMEAAKNMVKYSQYNMAEIASVLNYSSQSHFTAVFRKYFHDTPAQFRQKFHRAHPVLEPRE